MACFTQVYLEPQSPQTQLPDTYKYMSSSIIFRWSLAMWIGTKFFLKPGMHLNRRMLTSDSLSVKANWAPVCLSNKLGAVERGGRNSSKGLHPSLLLLILLNRHSNKMTPDAIFLYPYICALSHHQKSFILQQMVLTQRPTTGHIKSKRLEGSGLNGMSISVSYHFHRGPGIYLEEGVHFKNETQGS